MLYITSKRQLNMKTIELDFCKLDFFDHYFIGTIYEGVLINKKKADTIIQIALKYFESTPFVIISNRVHSFSIDPSIYTKLKLIDTLVGFTIVTNSSKVISNSSLEKIFYGKPFSVHSNFDTAINWSISLVKNQT